MKFNLIKSKIVLWKIIKISLLLYFVYITSFLLIHKAKRDVELNKILVSEFGEYLEKDGWFDKYHNVNCTDFVQSAWEKAGFDGSFADDIATSILAKMGFAGIWSWFWQKDTDLTGDLSGAWANAKIGNPDDEIEGAIENIWNKPSPIALDINKSGKIETTLLANSKTYFDIDNDGFSENVEWLSGGDGWLIKNYNFCSSFVNVRVA